MFSVSGAAPSGSPLAEDEDEDDPELLDNDVPDLRSFTIETMKQWVDSGRCSTAHLFDGFDDAICCFHPQTVRKRGDQAVLWDPVWTVQYEILFTTTGPVWWPSGLAL